MKEKGRGIQREGGGRSNFYCPEEEGRMEGGE